MLFCETKGRPLTSSLFKSFYINVLPSELGYIYVEFQFEDVQRWKLEYARNVEYEFEVRICPKDFLSQGLVT